LSVTCPEDLTDLGNNRMHIRVASMGFGADEESMAMRKFFERGNASTIETLQKHFDSGLVGHD
jgi:hypothetical protein